MNKKTFKLSESDLVEITNCPLCGSNRRQVLRTQKNISIYQEIYPKYSLVVPDLFSKRELLCCQDCGQVYWGVIPMFKALPSAYAEIIDYCFDENRGLHKKAELLNKLLPSDGILVDIGACRGELLSAIRDLNPEAVLLGIEPSFELLNEQKDIRVIQALFNVEAPLQRNSVSVFSFIDVFEHLPNIDETFLAISLFLKNDGFVYIETPDGDYSFNHSIRDNNMNLFWIEHFSFLTRQSIAYICRQYGYEAILIKNIGHVDTSGFYRFRSMLKSFAISKVFQHDNPMYINSSDHLKIILKKI